MLDEIEIRESGPADLAALEKLYPAAFPDEDLLPLLRDLLKEEPLVLSLVAVTDQTLVGHAVFTVCGLAGCADKLAMLGPLAVVPDRQRGGIGSALVREGFERLAAVGATRVYVLGDPAYYGRFGFEHEDGVLPPYALPEEWQGAWQALSLRGDQAHLRGKLAVPPPWQNPVLWGP